MAPPGELLVNAGVVLLAGNTVWSTAERIRGEVLTTMHYTNWRLPYLTLPGKGAVLPWSAGGVLISLSQAVETAGGLVLSLWRMASATSDLPSHRGLSPFNRYQFILLGEQRHMCVNNLPRVVTWSGAAGTRTCNCNLPVLFLLTGTSIRSIVYCICFTNIVFVYVSGLLAFCCF